MSCMCAHPHYHKQHLLLLPRCCRLVVSGGIRWVVAHPGRVAGLPLTAP